MTSNIFPTFRKIVGSVTAVALAGLTTQALAAEFYGDAYGFSAGNTGARGAAASMRVTGPQGFAVESDSLSYSSDRPLPDGSYAYEITGKVSRASSAVDVKRTMNQGRSARARPGRATGVIDSGYFRIKGGQIYIPQGEKE